MTRRILLGLALSLLQGLPAPMAFAAETPRGTEQRHACFLLFEPGVGERRRDPAEACRTPVSPASTFKIPHALAALDAGVIDGPDAIIAYDGSPQWAETWRRDHSLASAMRYSVVWYFQAIARRLGLERERDYLARFSYGNQDTGGDLTHFWLGRALQITPEGQLAFLADLYRDALPVSEASMASVRQILVQPRDKVVNALGEHPFAAPWPQDAKLSAKTGSATDTSGRAVRWLVGQVQRGQRSFIFVSCVIGSPDLDASAAIELAARALREERVL
ncbi:penicillin-binding transpeptidase domain-containing protein [Pseudomonas sp. RIT-PI-AD]|uniref:penicillin-binding transpeptidase domain-containing protein n=1 Tax=Pseudomonas sp. RIT-PI-AD TaxID=3035294 RepID=UPI0021D8F7CF|nr:penicillin-binding transpeptidase domain-containing protein [Pseudomonas sp. RIT-PI-AD]